ncbi:MAG: aminoacyl-tRNA hydrolase [Firmicutes bacterium]|nr:aminoacyl-tRNA hydrolase [Bacillota bacterium]
MKLIIGLGNPGARYAYTYHNLGFLAVEALADKLNTNFKVKECNSIVARVFSHDLVIAKPQTFMNLSGIAVKGLLKKYKLMPKDMIIVYDDIDIERGVMRFRERGSAGTHNGMRSIISEIGTDDFKRLRLGIGRSDNMSLADYVLSEIDKDSRPIFIELIEKAVEFLTI